MKDLHEIYYQAQKKLEEEELKQIIDKPMLSPEEIWTISDRNFYLWRRKHDYPRLIKYFSQNLKGFEDWKNKYAINDQFLISYGLSNCLKGNPRKNLTKYLIQSKWNDRVSKFVSFENLDNKSYRFGPDPVNHKLIKTFIGFVDWARKEKIEVFPDRRLESLFMYNQKSYVHTPDIKVNILNDLELLKIGGIKITPDRLSLIKPKYFDFVNADYLELEGRMTTGGKKLIFDNSSVDNLKCNGLDLALVEIHDSNIQEFEITNSDIRQWLFSNSTVSGRLENSDLANSSILGGSFYVDFRNTRISNVTARHSKKKEISFESTYRTLKQLYATQGEDKKAVEYFLLEKKIERLRLVKELLHPHIRTLFKPNRIVLIWHYFKKWFSDLVKLFSSWINWLYWGYGRQPLKIVLNSFLIILLFAGLYLINKDLINIPHSITCLDALYYSTITFFTLGLNQIELEGCAKVIAIIEAIVGGLSLGFLVGGLSNTKY